MTIESDSDLWFFYREYEYASVGDVSGSWICRVRKDEKEVYKNAGKVPSGSMLEAVSAAKRDAINHIDNLYINNLNLD